MVSTSIKKYRNANAESVVDANPHQLISLILRHILSNIAIASGAIARKEIENKGKAISKSIALVGELQDSLDMENGGEVSQNLFNLYEYVVRTLIDANIGSDVDKLEEVRGLISTIKEGWDAIPLDKRVKPT